MAAVPSTDWLRALHTLHATRWARSSAVRPMNQRTLEECPGCGLLAPQRREGPISSALRFGASSSCWAVYSEVVRREYGSRALFADVHPLTLDTYTAQHPANLPDDMLDAALLRLRGVFELGYDITSASTRVRRFARGGRDFDHLDPPARHPELTVSHVLWATSELDHVRRVWEWAEVVWRWWEPHHEEIARWAGSGGGAG